MNRQLHNTANDCEDSINQTMDVEETNEIRMSTPHLQPRRIPWPPSLPSNEMVIRRTRAWLNDGLKFEQVLTEKLQEDGIGLSAMPLCSDEHQELRFERY